MSNTSLFCHLFSVAMKTYYESKKTQQRKKNNNPNRYKDAARNQRRIHVGFLSEKIQTLNSFKQVYLLLTILAKAT